MLQIQPFSMLILLLRVLLVLFQSVFLFFSLFPLPYLCFLSLHSHPLFLFIRIFSSSAIAPSLFVNSRLISSNPVYQIVCSLWKSIRIITFSPKNEMSRKFIHFWTAIKMETLPRMHRCSDNTKASNSKANTLTCRNFDLLAWKICERKYLFSTRVEAIWQYLCMTIHWQTAR